jgi:antibiotic biosynthesis monooxygenase (ABM) superfamily enzyme
VICRLWHGWTCASDADAYEAYLRDDLYPRLERDLAGKGYRGHHVLRRTVGEEVEFVTMTWFDSLDTVRGFAGDEYETPVITEAAALLLRRYDPKASHFELAAKCAEELK